ncbi:hypothetical protein GCM10011575_13580 [Microlunatus endophyticus]|uniref:Uncharacterized protein n=1 Tax=Microlunatus endophyticus TaxID=1716077 RepID=A0A917S5K3_9ACTN|nr:DUF2231 domain-containing protein [Microlunatus endophyticus]GGL56399.1 hypothetical protein GCM10011575_13580 [Microlunatus endophyticus]
MPAPLFITVFGLPFHPLVVHATVVVVPVAAVVVLFAAVWPQFRRWINWGAPALALLAVVLDPLTTASGDALRHQLPPSPLIARHAELADGLLPWLIALAVGALAVFTARLPWVRRRWTLPPVLVAIATVLAVVSAIGSLVWVTLVGHAGAAAAWHGVGG